MKRIVLCGHRKHNWCEPQGLAECVRRKEWFLSWIKVRRHWAKKHCLSHIVNKSRDNPLDEFVLNFPRASLASCYWSWKANIKSEVSEVKIEAVRELLAADHEWAEEIYSRWDLLHGPGGGPVCRGGGGAGGAHCPSSLVSISSGEPLCKFCGSVLLGKLSWCGMIGKRWGTGNGWGWR